MTKKRIQPVKAAKRELAKEANPATSRSPQLVTEPLRQQSKIRNFENKVGELFSDDERLDALLSLEKNNRGINQNQLVFAGLSDVSVQTFCSMKAVLRARESEKMYFEAYLRDRLYYANGVPSVSGRGAGRDPQETRGSSQDSSPKDTAGLL